QCHCRGLFRHTPGSPPTAWSSLLRHHTRSQQAFNVQVQSLDVTVTGTAFNVDLESNTIEVAVQHGSVKASECDSQRLLNPGLIAGQRLDVDRY
ncbi:FecR domain-containing protein, partial [Pseudomonas viridiflava]|uniref:FecR domain-containing protein n=1 Tax=Pseudomonas viridiflava TaxID=33069 RepID=UPI0019D1F59D